jgi:hypothetical protein
MEGIMILWEEAVALDLQVLQADTSHQLEGKHSVGVCMAIKLLWLYRDYHGFRRAHYNKKAGNALAAVTARVLAVRGANRGDKGLSAMVEYYTGVAARLTSRVNSRGFNGQ